MAQKTRRLSTIHPAPNRSLHNWIVVCRPSSPIAVVSEISLGHTCTQFCALPQSLRPPYDGVQTLRLIGATGRMRVQQPHLGQRGWTDKGLVVTMSFAELRTDRHAAATTHAATVQIIACLLLWRQARGALVIVPGAMDTHPCLHACEVCQQPRAVRHQVTHHR
jgi:hypothetical protein